MTVNYVQRAIKKTGSDVHSKVHLAAHNTKTLCGKELNPMWIITGSPAIEAQKKNVTCAECIKASNA